MSMSVASQTVGSVTLYVGSVTPSGFVKVKILNGSISVLH